MRRTFWTAVAVLLASIVNAVPSKAALHPQTARCALKESDITGSGREVPQAQATRRNACGEQPSTNVIREWRAMVARCRNLAQWQNAEAREVLLELAQEYEARAERAERRPTG